MVSQKVFNLTKILNFLGIFGGLCGRILKTKLKFNYTHHPHIDRQIEIVNKSLGNLLRCLVGDNPKGWDLILP